jgi:hypothetical protein
LAVLRTLFGVPWVPHSRRPATIHPNGVAVDAVSIESGSKTALPDNVQIPQKKPRSGAGA